MELDELKALKSNQIKALREAGYNTVESVATATITEIKDVATIGDVTADKIWRESQELLFPNQFIPASRLMEIREHNIQQLTTGSRALDELLGGGIETQTITEFSGEYGVGKTEMCFQLSVNTQLPSEQHGFGEAAGVLFIDTERTFRANRVAQIAENRQLDSKQILDHITYAEAYTSDHQAFLLNHADKIIQENNIRLIVIDSLMAHFRSEYIGRESLAPRQQKLNKHLRKLQRLARAFNCAAVITNQAVASPQLFATPLKPTGGHIVAHASTTRIWLRRPKPLESTRIARLIESPWLPTGETVFCITERGIEDKNRKKRR